MTVLEAALDYIQRGFSVLPILPGEKRPILRWEEFQIRKASPSEVEKWLKKYPGANIGIVCGKISGISVIDIDPRNGGRESIVRLKKEQRRLPKTTAISTPSGGYHAYYRYPKDRPVRTLHGIYPGVDLNSDKAYVVAPPSRLKNGKSYTLVEPWESLSAIPLWVLELLKNQNRKSPLLKSGLKLFEPLGEGKRNDTLFRYSCRIRVLGYDYEEAKVLVLHWARKCHPPLPEEETLALLESAWQYSGREADEAEADSLDEGTLDKGYFKEFKGFILGGQKPDGEDIF